ncbi:hypothetical protein BRD20_09990 [Halobacteriales archaeon SW_8_65_20]|nr:MAG: hypothetical protein BRD20_09990 [Halobacteriales archaeon SW_8_65_20]
MDEPEFLFELRVCRWAEQHWPPTGDRDLDSSVLVARQLGIRSRRYDTLVFECDTAALDARGVLGEDRLEPDMLHVLTNAPSSYGYYRDVLPDPGYSWSHVRETIHDADARGLVDTRRDGNRIEIRRRYRYPDWVNRVIAIENKPDLSASAADALIDQIERDVALGLADEVWVATETTDEEVSPALFERLPVEAGILAVGDEVNVAWNATALEPEERGTRILDRPDGGSYDQSAARFEYASPDWKRAKRRRIAERAYERGWRSYVETMRPDCRAFELRSPDTPLPYCRAKERHVTAAECRHACESFAPEPPAWRSNGWPIEGGPGRGYTRLLARQRSRRR